MRVALLALALAGCSTGHSPVQPAPVCTPGCPSSQVCVTVCPDGGPKATQCLVNTSGDIYTAPDGAAVYDVCMGF